MRWYPLASPSEISGLPGSLSPESIAAKALRPPPGAQAAAVTRLARHLPIHLQRAKPAREERRGQARRDVRQSTQPDGSVPGAGVIVSECLKLDLNEMHRLPLQPMSL
jgi:hypothetical protein